MSKYSGNLDFLNYKSSMSIVILIVSFYFYLQFALTPTFNLVETGWICDASKHASILCRSFLFFCVLFGPISLRAQ